MYDVYGMWVICIIYIKYLYVKIILNFKCLIAETKTKRPADFYVNLQRLNLFLFKCYVTNSTNGIKS